MVPYKPGDKVRFKTQWPWAQREVEILSLLDERGNCVGRALPPFSDCWHESPESGSQMWIPPDTVVEVTHGA